MKAKGMRCVAIMRLWAVMLVIPVIGLASGARVWTSRSGDTVSASLVRQTGNLVVLETEDGQQFRIYATELSAEDQAYLRQQAVPGGAPVLPGPGGGGAGPGPVGPPAADAEQVPEERATRIACELTEVPTSREVPFLDTASDRRDLLGTYHYNVWLPRGYHADQARRWPCIFIASPGGNATMGPMADWLRGNGHVVILLVESRNGPVKPMIGNFLAAHDDAVRRFRLSEDGKIATGFSGGARAASLFVQMRPGFRGLILQGAGASQGSDAQYEVDGIRRNSNLRVAMIMGETDTNRREIARVQAVMRRDRFRVFLFDGGHAWAPAATFAEAANWVIER